MDRETKVVVSRLWDNQEVTAFVTNVSIGVEMDLDSFLWVLCFKAGVSEDVRSKLLAVAPSILTRIKQETAKVVI